jgi:uncharacterized protein YdeI (YjbR/CyaY-like superfamily)
MASVRVEPTRIREFVDEKSFHAWLGKHWNREPEVWIKIHKVGSGRPSITPAQAIDVVLCWGWIDGIRKSFDADSFLQRYSPRGKKSVWSQINVANVARLVAEKKMQPSGLAQVDAAKADGRWDKAYRMKDAAPPADLLAAIEAVPEARADGEPEDRSGAHEEDRCVRRDAGEGRDDSPQWQGPRAQVTRPTGVWRRRRWWLPSSGGSRHGK